MQHDEFGVESYVSVTNESQLAFINQSCLIVSILGMFQLFVNSPNMRADLSTSGRLHG